MISDETMKPAVYQHLLKATRCSRDRRRASFPRQIDAMLRPDWHARTSLLHIGGR